MKPNWENAPEWAQYFAQDEDGTWWWFECEPSKNQWAWLEVENTRMEIVKSENWQNSLEKNPTK